MATDRAPAVQHYPKDWRDVKVRRMSLAAQGAYRALCDDMWVDSKDQCSVLDCDPFIAKSLGVSLKKWMQLRKEIQHDIEPLFIEKDGRLYSKRLKAEAMKQRKFSEKQRKNGRLGLQKRWGNDDGQRHDLGIAKHSSSSSSSSSLKSSLHLNKKKIKKEAVETVKTVDKSGMGITRLSAALTELFKGHVPIGEEPAT